MVVMGTRDSSDSAHWTSGWFMNASSSVAGHGEILRGRHIWLPVIHLLVLLLGSLIGCCTDSFLTFRSMKRGVN